MGSEHGADPKVHFVLFPFLAQGHIIPMVDLAILLAHRGVLVSLVTTPLNASRLRPSIDRARDSELPIKIVSLPFPSADVGLQEGLESVDALPPVHEVGERFIAAVRLLEGPLRQYLRDRPPLPTCLVSDFCHPWTRKVTSDLGIPRYVFYSVSCFTLYCHCVVPRYSITDEHEPFVIAGLPDQVEITKAQAPGFLAGSPLREQAKEADATADGIVTNTFEGMESAYVGLYAAAMGRKVWPVGPVCLANKNGAAARGAMSSVEEGTVSRWLDSMGPMSVVYACFGSHTRIHPDQMKEIALGLEAAGRPFVLVSRPVKGYSEPFEAWLVEEGFEERNGDRALVIRGWAPQAMILSHPSVGGFVTHCGWNSSMEGTCAGLPMVTWPRFADQFLNERFLVNVVRTGVPVGVSVPNEWWSTEEAQLVTKEEVAVAVRRLMDEGGEGEGRRRRARELKEEAEKAVAMGGSSHDYVTGLIDEVCNKHAKNGELLQK